MKKSILWILLDLVFLVVFNTVFFVAGGFEHTASVWISYGFIHFAYLMVIVTPLLIRKSSSAAVFGFSLYSISSTYFLFEFVVGLIFILVNSSSYKAALIVQVIVAGLYAILLLSHLIANENTADSVERHEEEVAYIKAASSRVKALVGKANDKKANKEIEKAYDTLHSSPTKSISSVKAIESDILGKVADLENAVKSNSADKVIMFADEIIALTGERNAKVKLQG
ncbi:MAG: hypothetical protein LUH56_07185 [Oscillospiraceae bacterium]|nr:hypothetical protein [Oscillospiraceae bacterium]